MSHQLKGIDMDYIVITKGEGGSLASLQPSRDEAAEFWRELTGAEIDHTLGLMGDREQAQGSDPRAQGGRMVCTLETPEGDGYPFMLWGERSGELSELTFIPVEDHRATALARQGEPA
jgi:hypothetical protein